MKFTFKFPISTLFKYKPQKFNFGLEQEIRLKLNSLPSVTKIYTNPDGSPRVLLMKNSKLLLNYKTCIIKEIIQNGIGYYQEFQRSITIIQR